MLLGISIHENVELGIVDVGPNTASANINEAQLVRRLYPGDDGRVPLDAYTFYRSRVLLGRSRMAQVTTAIADFLSQASDHLKSIDRITIATIGIVKDQTILLNEPRAEWDDFQPVDFAALLKKLLMQGDDCLVQSPDVFDSIVVVNDAAATATCVNAIDNDGPLDRRIGPSYVYVETHDGVNISHVHQASIIWSRAHPEFGHLYPNLHKMDADHHVVGSCIFHRNCYEGVLSERAFESRIRAGLSLTPMDISSLKSFYLAQMIYTITMTIAPDRIVVGGPLAQKDVLDEAVARFKDMVGNYWNVDDANKPGYVRPSVVTKSDAILPGALAVGLAAATMEIKRAVLQRRGNVPIFLTIE